MPRSFALVVLLALLWGAAFPLVKVAVDTIPPLTVTAVRALLGGLLLLAALGPSGARQLWKAATGSMVYVTQSLFNCVLPWTLLAWASRSIDAGLATILNSLSPIFIFLLTWAITRHEPATARKFTGVALGLAGVVAIIGVNAFSGAGTHTLAELACVAGSFCYAVAAIIGRRFDNVSPLVPATGSVLMAAVVMVPIALVVEQPWTLSPSAASMASVAGLAVFSTGFAFVVYFRLLSTVGSIATSSQAYLRILVGVVLGMVFLGERLSTSVMIGLPLVIAGVVAMTMPARRPR
jgi:drug/metabolite transporter (DMT)-like permease